MKVRIELVGGNLCGRPDTTVDAPAGELPALYVGPAGEQYLRTGRSTQQGSGPRLYEYCVPAAQLGRPRPQTTRRCCAVPGRYCPLREQT